MNNRSITFDDVFLQWLKVEVEQIEGRDILSVAKSKGFTSIAEWRLSTALRIGLDKKSWHEEDISNPNEEVPKIIIGPFKGWSRFFENNLSTTFEEALEIPEFFEWCKTHDRVIPISQNFPSPTALIVLRKADGKLVHIEGGHRMCAVAYSKKIGKPIDFTNKTPIKIFVADFTDEDQKLFEDFLATGTDK